MKPQAKQTKLIKASDVDDKKEEDDQPFRVEQVEEDQFGRKVWRVVKGEEYLQKEQEEQQANQDDEEEDDEDEEDNGPTFLQRRTQDLKLDRVVGQRQQVSANEDLRNLGVYNCPVCEVTCKDSNSWLDHINGKKHNQLLGMSMKVERVGIDRVKDKFQQLKKKSKQAVENFEDFDRKFEEKMQMQKQIKEAKKNKQKQLKQEALLQEIKQKEEEEKNLTDEQKQMIAMGIPLEMIQ